MDGYMTFDDFKEKYKSVLTDEMLHDLDLVEDTMQNRMDDALQDRDERS